MAFSRFKKAEPHRTVYRVREITSESAAIPQESCDFAVGTSDPAFVPAKNERIAEHGP